MSRCRDLADQIDCCPKSVYPQISWRHGAEQVASPRGSSSASRAPPRSLPPGSPSPLREPRRRGARQATRERTDLRIARCRDPSSRHGSGGSSEGARATRRRRRRGTACPSAWPLDSPRRGGQVVGAFRRGGSGLSRPRRAERPAASASRTRRRALIPSTPLWRATREGGPARPVSRVPSLRGSGYQFWWKARPRAVDARVSLVRQGR